MSNYYYDRSHKCYRKKRKKCDCECHCEPRYQTYTSGPLFRNANTDFIQVSALNQTDEPQTVTIAVQNYQDTCDGDTFPSYGYLCGELINDENDGSDDELNNRNGNGNGGCIYCEPEGVNPFVGPVTFTIPPRQLFSLRVFYPVDPVRPVDPLYVVRVTQPVDPVSPQDPTAPLDPIRPVTVNTWGINFAGVIQQGNTVLNGQFAPTDPILPGDPH
ncbi:sodium:proton exchanger [Bacillus toyonensis]|uniref:sodium:proton exchanger n=1 Tax=Bacillus toyonensis TaxID=155322 RepID=UPI000BEDE39F|nr:sodium:proton exchanger [Bacillus toyonensis]PDZ25449.1 sodium:proton exchanger [Bacillus toyonensis]PFY25194.1 sodium:proton exchanger [Bacillus toyonensis]PHG44659.1 sodium:proton exchanger [Bacillus toyonensis]